MLFLTAVVGFHWWQPTARFGCMKLHVLCNAYRMLCSVKVLHCVVVPAKMLLFSSGLFFSRMQVMVSNFKVRKS